jgi:hypothetical protein
MVHTWMTHGSHKVYRTEVKNAGAYTQNSIFDYQLLINQLTLRYYVQQTLLSPTGWCSNENRPG